MPPKAPLFWNDRNFLSTMLIPFAWIYGFFYKTKTRFAKPYISTLPVVCIGGVIVGGSGKTPIVHALLALIRTHNLFVNPVILTRGYGGDLKGPTLVDMNVHGVHEVGDEALLHADRGPTVVSRNRAVGAKLAESMGADIILMDDGLQNPSLHKDLSILVLGDAASMGNGLLLPAGPMRETLQSALGRCPVVITADKNFALSKENHMASKTLVQSGHDLDKEYYAFAGIGYPQKFKTTLENNGFRLIGFESFSDHYFYKDHDLNRLFERAGSAQLITTEKDWVRLPESMRHRIQFLRIATQFEDEEKILTHLKKLP